jgi:hypothetical protein
VRPRWVIPGVAVSLAWASASAAADPRPPTVQPAVAFPHPMIVEVLYAVPTGEEGDASKDGSRSATGDEFIAVVNPHQRAIQLKGYTLTDANAPRKGQLKFTFPNLQLEPGELAVVFNGFETAVKGETGTEDGATQRNESFHRAYVFSMRRKNSFSALGNSGDCVTLAAPDERLVHRVRWGKLDGDSSPKGVASIEDEAPVFSRGSVARTRAGEGGRFRPRPDLDKQDFDPGNWPIKEPETAEGPGVPKGDSPKQIPHTPPDDDPPPNPTPKPAGGSGPGPKPPR